MKKYSVDFNFYDETQGQFDTTSFNVEAENQFQARRMAWSLCENNERYAFMSKLQISGVSWESNPMDMQDYFNSKASRLKSFVCDIENVEKPNLYIRLLTGNSDFNKENYDYEIVCKDREIANYYGAIGAIDKIAQDFGQVHGIIPPSIFEELHFANHLLDTIESGEYSKLC